jgi:5,10-methylene-tetrahydrofolate dehydrogenase/methenyl tetrahydrofolate cyclohydrolase
MIKLNSFNSGNIGALSKKNTDPTFIPCTPQAIMELIKETGMIE